ncbi:MAG: family 10 glycosylhydrolase [Bdellovibrionales bacterium]|nr:family 10 glycosylhydrolase [Bdellovibrionales bacterium]
MTFKLRHFSGLVLSAAATRVGATPAPVPPPAQTMGPLCEGQRKVPPGERRGVWITNVDNDWYSSRAKLAGYLRMLKEIGVTDIYAGVWNKGVLFYHAPAALRAQIGESAYMEDVWRGRDILKEIIAEARPLGLRVYAWFESGLKVPYEMDLVQKHLDWLSKDNQGRLFTLFGTKKIARLNPFHPGVEKFMTELVTSVLKNYDIDGVQVDDHLSVEKILGYETFTVNLYRQETGREAPLLSAAPNAPLPAGWAEWTKWRADKLTAFMVRLSKRVRFESPRPYQFLISPQPYPWTYENYLQDWPEWVRLGIADGILMQIYRNDVPKFAQELQSPALQRARACVPVIVGILSGVANNIVSSDTIVQQVKASRSAGYDGVSFFHAATLLDNGQESPADRHEKLRQIFSNIHPAAPLQSIYSTGRQSAPEL